MAKKKTARPPEPPANDTPGPAAADGSQERADQSPKIRKAADAVRRAEAELQKARNLYQKVRQQATDRLKAAREKTVGDLIDGTLETVKKHPGPGVIVAVLIGFFLGRLFRR